MQRVRLWIIGGSFLALLFAASTVAARIGGEVALGGWRTSPEGTVAEEPLSSVDFLDVRDDLSFDDETEFTARMRIDMPGQIPNLSFLVNPMEFDGVSVRTVGFNFGGLSFGAGVPFDAKVRIDQYEFGLFYAFPLLGTGEERRLDAEAGVSLRIIDAEAEIRQFLLERTEEETFFVPLLYLGARFRLPGPFALETEARGISYGDDTLYSLVGRLKATAWDRVFVAGGYRYDDYDVDIEDFIIDADISGPFVETGFCF